MGPVEMMGSLLESTEVASGSSSSLEVPVLVSFVSLPELRTGREIPVPGPEAKIAVVKVPGPITHIAGGPFIPLEVLAPASVFPQPDPSFGTELSAPIMEVIPKDPIVPAKVSMDSEDALVVWAGPGPSDSMVSSVFLSLFLHWRLSHLPTYPLPVWGTRMGWN